MEPFVNFDRLEPALKTSSDERLAAAYRREARLQNFAASLLTLLAWLFDSPTLRVEVGELRGNAVACLENALCCFDECDAPAAVEAESLRLSPTDCASISGLMGQLVRVPNGGSTAGVNDWNAIQGNARLLNRIAETCLGGEDDGIRLLSDGVGAFLRVAEAIGDRESGESHAAKTYFQLRSETAALLRRAGQAEMADSLCA